MTLAMTSEREGNEDADFISPDDDTIDVTARTRVLAYANTRERNSFLHAGPSGSQPQPQRGRSHVKNPYNASVATPSNLSKYSDPEYFEATSNYQNIQILNILTTILQVQNPYVRPRYSRPLVTVRESTVKILKIQIFLWRESTVKILKILIFL
jgi:hypothetical protein